MRSRKGLPGEQDVCVVIIHQQDNASFWSACADARIKGKPQNKVNQTERLNGLERAEPDRTGGDTPGGNLLHLAAT